MLTATMQLESQGEGRESAMETLILVGYVSEGISDRFRIRFQMCVYPLGVEREICDQKPWLKHQYRE